MTAAALLVGLVPAASVAQETDPRQGLAPGTDNTNDPTQVVPNADAATASFNMEHLANRTKPVWAANAGAFNFSNIGSDLAFTGDFAISGNYLGFGVFDISDPTDPELVTVVNCPGGQGDVSVYGDLLFMSVESKRSNDSCASTTQSQGWSGLRIFDISDITSPTYVAAVNTCRGSHTHTVVEDPDDDANVYVYIQGTAGVRSGTGPWQMGCVNTVTSSIDRSLFLDEDGNPIPTSRFQIEVIKVPLAAPETAAIVSEPRVVSDPDTGNPHGLWEGGNHGPGTQSTAATDACHDITAYPEIGLAAGACEGNGILLDISDPAEPVRIDDVIDPNFAYWHSATFNNDGTKVVFTDEWGGGLGARCRQTDPENWGADAIFDIVDTDDGKRMEFRSHYKVPNVQATNETCVAHNASLVPVPGRDVMVQAWYEGGVSVFDFTDSSDPVEIAFFDRGPYHPTQLPAGGYWSAYWYNGNVFGNEIFLGFDSFGLTDSEHLSANELEATRAVTFDEFNAQAQTRITWAPSFVLSRAYLDQLVRADAISASDQEQVTKFLDRAEQFKDGPQRNAALATLHALANQLRSAEQATLANSLRELVAAMR